MAGKPKWQQLCEDWNRLVPIAKDAGIQRVRPVAVRAGISYAARAARIAELEAELRERLGPESFAEALRKAGGSKPNGPTLPRRMPNTRPVVPIIDDDSVDISYQGPLRPFSVTIRANGITRTHKSMAPHWGRALEIAARAAGALGFDLSEIPSKIDIEPK